MHTVLNAVGSVVMFSVPSLRNFRRVSVLDWSHLFIYIVRLGNVFNIKSFSVVSVLSCFRKRCHHKKGRETCVGMFIHKLYLRLSWSRRRLLYRKEGGGGAFDRQIR